MGEWLESGHAQLEVEMLQSDDIEIPSNHNAQLLVDELLQIFQQNPHHVHQFLDWLFNQLDQERHMNDVESDDSEEFLNDVP